MAVDAYQERQRRKAARSNLCDYLTYMRPKFRPFGFHRKLCHKLDQVERGEIKRLIICAPFRHGKSLVSSIGFPEYYLGRRPHNKIITVSYGAEVAMEFGREVRNTIASPRYQGVFPGTALMKDSKAKNRWHTNFGGQYIATGVGGPITSKGGNVIIVEDPHKNRKEADSKAKSDEVWNFWRSTLYSRQEPEFEEGDETAFVVIMQRWNSFDFVARLQEAAREEGGEQWEVVELPALADDDGNATDDWERGHALVPEMWPKTTLKKWKTTMGSRNWLSQCQQQPTDDSGNIVQKEWFRYWSHTPSEGAVALPKQFDEIIQSWDLTFKNAEENSRVAGGIWGRLGADVFLLDELCKHLSFVGSIRGVTGMTQKHPNAKLKLVETKANGPALESVLKKKIFGIVLVEPQGDKKARLWAVTPMMESGNVYLPSPTMPGYAWVEEYISEVIGFPNLPKNDRVDQTSQALAHFEKSQDNIFEHLSKL
jgi:predicted phage terminase large subunit-like protein